MEQQEVVSTFCTLMLWLVLLKIRLALMAFAKRRAYDLMSAHTSNDTELFRTTLTWFEISS